MATRNLTLITKNANEDGKSLPNTPNVEIGEGLVNTADGKLFYKGYVSGTGATPTYISSQEPNGNGYFEVGSHVSQLKIDDKIIDYDGVSDLSGKILSGTSSGFALADITDLQNDLDSYLTGATFDNSTETLTLSLNGGRPDVSVTLNDNVTTGGELIGSTIYFDTTDQLSAYTVDLSALDVNDTFVTGGTLDNANEELNFTNNDGGTFTVDISSLDINDTFVTGTTWDSNNNELTLQRNEGASDITQTIDAFNSLDVTTLSAGTLYNTSLTQGRVVYVGANGQLVDDSNFTFDDGADKKLSMGSFETASDGYGIIGTGGLEVGSGGTPSSAGTGDVIIHGDLTIYGETTSAHTSELYIEDHNFTLNYNPDEDTASSSLGAGFSVQDGLGVQGATGDTVFFEIAQTGGTPSNKAEAYDRRFWRTDLFNMSLGSTGGTGSGYFVVKEDDTIDGGSY